MARQGLGERQGRPSAAQAQARNRSTAFAAVAIVAVAAVAVALTFAFALPGVAPQDGADEHVTSGGSQSLAPSAVPASSDEEGSVGEAAIGATDESTDPVADPNTLTLLMAGDVLPHERAWKSGEQADGMYDFGHFFAHFAADIAAVDVAIVNQETVLGAPDRPLSDYPDFNSPQAIGRAEAQAGFDVVLKATNHTLDQDYDGLAEELAFWRSEEPDVAIAGVAMPYEQTASESKPPVIQTQNGVRVCVVNATYGLNGRDDPADAVCLLDEDLVRTQLAYAREAADVVVLCPHWGEEYSYEPTDEQREWAQLAADLGADVVIGAHPHVLQPVEALTAADGRQVPVYWSVGNFISDQEDDSTMLGGVARVTLSRDGDGAWRAVRAELITCVTHRGSGAEFSTWPLADYTQAQAEANANKTYGTVLSREELVETCEQVLGERFDPSTCTFTLDLEG